MTYSLESGPTEVLRVEPEVRRVSELGLGDIGIIADIIGVESQEADLTISEAITLKHSFSEARISFKPESGVANIRYHPYDEYDGKIIDLNFYPTVVRMGVDKVDFFSQRVALNRHGSLESFLETVSLSKEAVEISTRSMLSETDPRILEAVVRPAPISQE